MACMAMAQSTSYPSRNDLHNQCLWTVHCPAVSLMEWRCRASYLASHGTLASYLSLWSAQQLKPIDLKCAGPVALLPPKRRWEIERTNFPLFHHTMNSCSQAVCDCGGASRFQSIWLLSSWGAHFICPSSSLSASPVGYCAPTALIDDLVLIFVSPPVNVVSLLLSLFNSYSFIASNSIQWLSLLFKRQISPP